MGDMADVLTDEGEDLYFRHLAGDCGPDPCPYCEPEDSIAVYKRQQALEEEAREDRDGVEHAWT